MWLTRLLLLKELKKINGGGIQCERAVNTETRAAAPETFESPTLPDAVIVEDVVSSDSLFLSTQRICRLCGNAAHTSLLENIDGFDLLNAIRVVTNISIKPDDCYPKYVCSDCLGELKTAYAFKRKCEETDMKYRQLVTYEYASEPPPDFTRHDFTLLLEQMTSRRTLLQQQRLQTENKRTKTLKKAVKKPINQFMCISCDVPFYDREKLLQHRAERACVRRPCPTCRKLVLNLPVHVRRMHRRRPLCKCPHCDKAFRNISILKAHMHVHSERCDYKCELCPYRGKQRAYLALHMRTHTGERPYLCSQCPATFVNASNFRKHRLVHASKQFQCTKCNKLFRQAKSLRDHDEAAHQQIRHPCALCGKIFTYRSRLLRHELRFHNREKRKLNPATTTQVLPVVDPAASVQASDRIHITSIENVPLDTYLAFKHMKSQHADEIIVNEELLNVANSEIVFTCE